MTNARARCLGSLSIALAFALAGCGATVSPVGADVDAADVDTAAPGDVGDAGDPGAIGALGLPCDKQGALACAGHAQKLELICDGGVWKSNGVCTGAQLCDTRVGVTAGSCQDPDAACVGKKPNETFCEAAVRRTCGADLLTSTTMTCGSAELCGASSGATCAKCLDGQTHCDGPLLTKCKSDHSGFATADTCATAALCVEASGKCAAPACAIGDYRCNGDTLQTCQPTRVDWDPVKVCSPGMCDAAAKNCRECVAGSRDCAAGNTPRSCDATGHWSSLTACSAPTPLCKAGICSPGICATGEARCTTDTLETCNATFDGFDPVKVCAAGLCDVSSKSCLECKPGAAECVGSTPRACDSTGHWKSLTACAGTTPLCKAGVCSAGACVAGQVRCNVDTLETCNATFTGFDPVKTCGPGLCDAVGKRCKCPGTTVSCGSSCVDTTSDGANCGACGVVCASGATCTASKCVCATGASVCSGVCVDKTSDKANCGACGTVCVSTQTCVSSVCTCPSGQTLCGSKCTDRTTDAANCGACGTVCPSATPYCVASACTTLPKCNSPTAPKVLFYGPVGSLEEPYVPVGSVITVAGDAMWRAMVTSDFASYQLIIIGEGNYGSAPPWDAALATKDVWGPAITGRIFVDTLDPVAHIGRSGAVNELKAALSWTATGPGAGLYVGPDYGSRKLDFLAYFGAWTAVGQIAEGVSGDDVHIDVPSHGSMVGSTDASLSGWGSSYHGAITSYPAGFVVVASVVSVPTRYVIVAKDVACAP